MRWRKIKQNPKSSSQTKSYKSDSIPNKSPNIPKTLPLLLEQELKQTPSVSLQIAGFLNRGKAQVIDTFMIYLPIMYLMTYGILGSKEALWSSIWAPSVAVSLYGIIVAIFIAKKGQTPGKKAYNLWIVRENGKNVTFFFALLRFFIFLLSGVSFLGLLMPLWRKDKKALHDILLKTIVLQKG